MVELLALISKRNVLTYREDDSGCYNLCGLQTDHNRQLKSQLILVRRPSMTNRQYVLAIIKGAALILAWGLLLIGLIRYFGIELREPHAPLKFLGFFAVLWLPAQLFTRDVRREMQRRR